MPSDSTAPTQGIDPKDDRLPVDRPPKEDGDDTVHGTIKKPKDVS